jgi:hypothetical protein
MTTINFTFLIAVSLMLAGIITVARPATPGVDEHTRLLFQFDAGKGNQVEDLSGNGNDGVITGAKWVSGQFDQALQFTDDDFVEVPASESLDLTEHITIEVWVNPADDDCGYALLKKNAYGFPKFLGGNDLQFYLQSGGQQPIASVIGQVTVKEWHHYAAVYDGQEMRLYVDAELVQTLEHKGSIDVSADNITIGHSFGWHANGARNFAGSIDELRISVVARSVAELKEAMRGFSAAAVNEVDKLALSWGEIKK